MPPPDELPLFTRLWFAWVVFFRVLFDASFAARAFAAQSPALGPPADTAALPPKAAEAAAKVVEKLVEKPVEEAAARPIDEPAARPLPAAPPLDPMTSALQLLALFQREGRLVDFLEQDIAGFGDADIADVARLVHEGCRKALHEHAKLAPVRREEEGASVTIDAGYRASEIKLIGDVAGSAPYRGALRHRGWRAESFSLPTPVADHDARVVAPAEVEL